MIMDMMAVVDMVMITGMGTRTIAMDTIMDTRMTILTETTLHMQVIRMTMAHRIRMAIITSSFPTT